MSVERKVLESFEFNSGINFETVDLTNPFHKLVLKQVLMEWGVSEEDASLVIHSLTEDEEESEGPIPSGGNPMAGGEEQPPEGPPVKPRQGDSDEAKKAAENGSVAADLAVQYAQKEKEENGEDN